MASSILYSTAGSVIAVPSGINRELVVAVSNSANNTLPTSVTIGTESLNISGSAARTTDFITSIWTLPTNIAPGNYDLVISGGAPANSNYFTYVIDHVDPIPATTIYSVSTRNADGQANSSVNLNTLAGAIVISSIVTSTGDGTTIVASTNLTKDTGTVRRSIGHNSGTLNTEATTFIWDWSGTRNWAETIICFNVMDSDYYGAILSSTWIM